MRANAFVLLLVLSLCVAAPTPAAAPAPAPTANVPALIRRVRHLRRRLHDVQRSSRQLATRRDSLEHSIADARTRLDEFAPNAVLHDAKVLRQAGAVQELVAEYRQKRTELQHALTLLHVEQQELREERTEAAARLQALSLSDVVVRHATHLPPVMRGALLKGAAALTPVFHSLLAVADTNDRLVQHVSAEIDRYTHFGLAASPFMSGMLFYCVLLIPTLTLIVLLRAVADSSAKLSATHAILAVSSYLVVTCLVFVLFASFARDPLKLLYAKHERLVVVCNLLLAAYYIWFLCIVGTEVSDHGDMRDAAQLLAAASVALHYFVFAWRRIFTDQPPKLLVSNYLVYATIFAFIAYERCMRINPRWIADSSVFKYARSVDIPLSFAFLQSTFNRNLLRNVRRKVAALVANTSDALLALLHRPHRWPRRRRRGRNARDRPSATDSPPSPARITATSGKGVVGLSLSRARRCALYTRFNDASDNSSLSASDSDTVDEAAAEPLLTRASTRTAAKSNARLLLPSRSRSRSGSGDSPDDARGWWWSRRGADTDPHEPIREDKVARTRHRSRYERNNARPRKERDAYVGRAPTGGGFFSLWKWP